MSLFVPRTADDVTEALLAKILARTSLTDTTEGSVLYGIVRPVAEEIANGDFRILQIRNSFDILNPNITLADFDERAKELPGGGFARLGKVAAAGSIMFVSRKDVLAEQIMPAGATFGRADGSPLLYRTLVDVTFAIGVAAVQGIYAVCTTPGAAGNCGIGVISKSISAPSWVISAVNIVGLANGANDESLLQAQQRAALYLSSLGGSQKAALEYLALTFVSSDNIKAKFAKAFVNPMKPGHAQLVVDDGSGFTSLVKENAGGTSGTVPKGGQTVIAHEGPATKSLGYIEKLPVGGGLKFTLYDTDSPAASQMKSIYESGFVYVEPNKSWSLIEGDIWYLPKFSVYTGYLAELQAKVLGDVNNGIGSVGWAALGCRVSVKPPDVVTLSVAVHVVPQNGVDLTLVQNQAINGVVEFVNNLGPGEPLYIASLIAAIMISPDVLNVKFFQPGTSPAVAQQDKYVSENQVIRTDKNKITFVLGSS